MMQVLSGQGSKTSELAAKLAPFPAISTIVKATLDHWPEHEQYCEKRFLGDSPEFLRRCDEFSQLALQMVGDALAEYVRDYRWMCEEFLQEEFFFHREKRYRRSSFAEAESQIYGNSEYMSRYVHGILISQILWHPHALAFDLFRTRFLAGLPESSSYLEVGPGHGFFLFFASKTPAIAKLEAWDVSRSSIRETKSALSRLGADRDIRIVEQDVLQAPPRDREFDGAVISEVLEHLERPDRALQTLHAALRPGGRIFINAPVNSPAPDHIYLWRSPEEFHEFVKAQGFVIDEAWDLPQTGVSLDRARKLGVSISCVLIARKAS